MLRSHKQPHHFDDADDEPDDDDDDEDRHSSIELKDILKRTLPTATSADTDDTTDTSDDETDAADTDSGTAAAGVDDVNYIGRLTPQYSKTHRHRTLIPRKTAALAAFLTIVGIGFLTTGLSLWLTGGEGGLGESVPFLVLGGLSFVPGSFHVVILYLAYTGQYGWTYDNIPTYDRQ